MSARNAGDRDRIGVEEITRVVLQVMAAQEEQRNHPANGFVGLLRLLSAHWAVLVFALSVLAAIVGWFAFGVSLLQPLEELGHRQQEYRREATQLAYRDRMIDRHLQLGNSFLNVHQVEEALVEFKEVLKLDPVNTAAQLGLIKVQVFEPIAKGLYDPEVSERRLRLIQEELPNDAHVSLFLGRVYQSIDSDQAIDFYQAAISEDPSLASAHSSLGYLYDLDNRIEESLAAYETALRLSPWNQPVLNNLAYQYVKLGRYDEAILKYELLLSLDPRFLLTHFSLAKSHLLQGALNEAHTYQLQLNRLLADSSVLALPRNQREFVFPSDDRWVHLRDYHSKTYYAFYSAALSSYLLGDNVAADDYIRKAELLNPVNVPLLHDLMRSDIRRLQDEQAQYAEKADEFVKRHL